MPFYTNLRHGFSLKCLLSRFYHLFLLWGMKGCKVSIQLSRYCCVRRKEAMYERPHVNVNGEQGSTITFTRYLPYIALLIYARKTLNAFARKNCTTVPIYLNAKYRPLVNSLFFKAPSTCKTKHLM